MSQEFDDLVNQVQDLQTANDNNQPIIDGLSQIQQPDGTVRSQLDFPLDEQSVSEILGVFQFGTVTLSAGAATVLNSFLGPASTIVFCLITPGGTPGTITLTQTNGSFTLTSSSGSDASTFNWFAVP